jgi:hypothetical protein
LPAPAMRVGMLVFMHPRRDTLKMDTMIDYALQKQLAVLYVTTDNRLEFFLILPDSKSSNPTCKR